ncbi:MAG: SEC-C metal-binding domain-containing protein, partial [Rikenellaceae bacterium]
KYAAVIEKVNELVAKGRPVLVGTTSVEISELLSKMMKLRGIQHNVLNAKQHQSEAMIVAEAGKAGQVTIATNMAGRGTDIKLSAEVKEAGGLAIIGTERHESRRVDRQLRGRAGRQGDPGSSQFFVSVEDNLMRLFGSERIAKMMDMMGLKDGESIQAKMITKAIERAQRKVEENHFGVRKRLLEYDDVMNSQREVIYSRRRHALYGERLEVDLQNMITDYAMSLVENYRIGSLEEFKLEVISLIGIEPTCTEKEFADLDDVALADHLVKDMQDCLKRRIDTIATMAFPVIERVYQEHGDSYENISVPITDGRRGLNVPVNLKKAIENKGQQIGKALSRVLMLVTIDEFWKEHLRDMDDLKQSVQNATYEQKDPLLIYKFESFELFKAMLDRYSASVLSMLLKAYLPVAPPQQGGQNQEAQRQVERAQAQLEQQRKRQAAEMNRLQMGRSEAMANAGAAERQKPAPVHVDKQVGRNDPCPCGSGKKYKACHGKA